MSPILMSNAMRSMKIITRSITYKRPKTIIKTSILPQPPTFFRDGIDPPKTLDELKNGRNNSQQETDFELSTENQQSPPPPPSSPSQNDNTKDDTFWKTIYFTSILVLSSIIVIQQQQIGESQRLNRTVHVTLNKLLITYKNQMERSHDQYQNLLQTRSLKHEMTTWKLLVHIALLRRQLLTSTKLTPIAIDQCLEEFFKIAKVSKSKTDAKVWVKDDCDIKQYIPSVNDYE